MHRKVEVGLSRERFRTKGPVGKIALPKVTISERGTNSLRFHHTPRWMKPKFPAPIFFPTRKFGPTMAAAFVSSPSPYNARMARAELASWARKF